MRSPRLRIEFGMLAATFAATACDAPDRAVSPDPSARNPQFAASPVSVLAPSIGFRKAITVDAIRAHQAGFQAIANQYGGVRSALDASHDAAVEYVRARMVAAGYNVTVQPFQFTYNGDLTLPEFSIVSPNPRVFVQGIDFGTLSGSGSGDVTGPVANVDLVIPSPGNSTSGCEAADFAGFPAGQIALVQRGTCEFRVKALNAQAAGAVAVIMMNEGNTAEREGLLTGTLGSPSVSIPVIGTTYAIGVQLANSVVTPIVRMKVNAAAGTVSSSNLIAESPGGDPNSVVVVGANLEGRFGPGINASSGAAAMIEIARVFAAQERDPRNRLRFIWFGAYPQGLVGGFQYVASLSTAQQARIKAAVDIGAIGSPNFGRFVLDSDLSEFSFPYPPNPAADAASGGIEALFAEYLTASGLPFAASIAGNGTALPFRNVGVPFGGIHTGYNIPKTAQEAATFGGTAGVFFDPCVWMACDNLANVNTTALDQMSDAAAHVVLALSKRNFAQKPLGGN